jgi:predicted alpha/beta hydrolase family esterase
MARLPITGILLIEPHDIAKNMSAKFWHPCPCTFSRLQQKKLEQKMPEISSNSL